MQRSDVKWWLGSAVLIGLLLYVLQHDFSRLRAPDLPFAGELVKLPTPACSPVGDPCAASDATRMLTLTLSGDVRPLRPFDLELRLPDTVLSQAGSATVDFVMVGMDMGLNRYTLTRWADGSYHAKVILPVCSSGRSDWVAKVSAIVGQQMWMAEFPFVAEPSMGQHD
ncbi:MAG: hypothetical protein ABWU16_05205 [Halothiobacillaceae bacterium]